MDKFTQHIETLAQMIESNCCDSYERVHATSNYRYTWICGAVTVYVTFEPDGCVGVMNSNSHAERMTIKANTPGAARLQQARESSLLGSIVAPLASHPSHVVRKLQDVFGPESGDATRPEEKTP